MTEPDASGPVAGSGVPDRRARPRRSPAAAVATAFAGVLVGIVVFLVVVRVAGTRSIPEPTEEGASFDVGPAEERGRAIARDATPLLFADPLGVGRDIYVHRLADGRWVAFEARAPGAPTRCVLRWEKGPQRLTDPCSGRHYAADGAGLVGYPARVDDDGRLLVDLRSPRRPAPVTTVPA